MRSKILAVLLFAFLLPAFLRADEIERSRKFIRTFRATNVTSIQVINKYGNIHMIPWNKDSVRFEIQISISGTKDSKVDRIFNNIDFDFTETKYYVIAQTRFSNSMNNIWSDITDMTSTLFSSGNKAMINYTVYFPKAAPVRIENKFGNVYTTDHIGKAEIILANGDLRAHDFKGELLLQQTFGNANAHSIDHGRLDLGYGEFNFEEVGEAELIGKSAQVKIDRAGRIKIDSRRDKLNFGRIGSLNGTSSFSYIRIDQLTDEALIVSKYGDLSVSSLGAALRLIDLNAEYTDISITYAPSTPLDLDITYDYKTQQIFTENVRKLPEEEVGEDEEDLHRGGLSVKGAGRYGKVRIRLVGGSLAI